MVYTRVTLGVLHSMGLDTCMTQIHHYNITVSIFTALKPSVLCLFIPPSPQPQATTDLFTFSIVLPFPECRIVAVTQYVTFQIGFFHLVICIEVSSVSFHGLTVCLFLVLGNIPWSGYIRIDPFPY